MIHDRVSALGATLQTAALDRLTLALNHTVMAEAQAVQRLRPHAGRRVLAQGPQRRSPWPLDRVVPLPVDTVAWRISPAGLLDRVALDGAAPDATMRMQAVSPAALARAWAANDASIVTVEGEPTLVEALRWVLDHVRWDYAGDLGRVLPAPLVAPAQATARTVIEGLARGVRALDARWPKSPSGGSR